MILSSSLRRCCSDTPHVPAIADNATLAAENAYRASVLSETEDLQKEDASDGSSLSMMNSNDEQAPLKIPIHADTAAVRDLRKAGPCPRRPLPAISQKC